MTIKSKAALVATTLFAASLVILIRAYIVGPNALVSVAAGVPHQETSTEAKLAQRFMDTTLNDGERLSILDSLVQNGSPDAQRALIALIPISMNPKQIWTTSPGGDYPAIRRVRALKVDLTELFAARIIELATAEPNDPEAQRLTCMTALTLHSRESLREALVAHAADNSANSDAAERALQTLEFFAAKIPSKTP